jgi:AraC-like DNA-binding protein
MDNVIWASEKIELGNISVVSDRDHEKFPPGSYPHPHFHSYWEIKFFTLPESGTKTCCLIAPGIIHLGSPAELMNTAVVISLQQPYLVISDFSNNRPECTLPFDNVDDLCPGGTVKLVEKISKLVSNQNNLPDKERLVNALLECFLSAVNTVAIATRNRKVKAFSLPDKAIRYIERNYYHPDLSVEQVASELGVSAGHLANMFKDEGLETVRQYIVRVRMENAHDLLRTGRYLVKEVAGMTGWNCQFYFTNSFRKYFGYSPSQVPCEPITKYTGGM